MKSIVQQDAFHERRSHPASKLRRGSKSVVMAVADVPANLQGLSVILDSAGYQVVAAINGPVALQMAQSLTPHLVLLDIVMPGIDAYAVCDALKQNESTRHIPVVFVSEILDSDAEARCFACGAADYITKPIVAPKLLARVKMHLALEGQRRHLEGMFRDVIEFAPDAFILSDIHGNIVQINARAEQLFGYSRDELTGMPLRMLMPQGKRKGEGVDPRKMPKLTMGVALPCRRKDGTEFPGDINLSPMDTNRGRLVMAVVRDVSERQKAQLELAESRQLLRELAAQDESTREGERKHIAREVHDELGQVLTALRMDMSLLGIRFGADDPILTDHIRRMKVSVDRAIQAVRNVATNLRPTALDMGLIPAIEWLSRQFTERTSVPCLLQTKDEDLSLDETRNVVVFRIVQESLTNIARYARASRVEITVALGADATTLQVEVRDNGCGFDVPLASGRKTFGLLGMRERAIALGGRVDCTSVIDQGTLIAVVIPIDAVPARIRR